MSKTLSTLYIGALVGLSSISFPHVAFADPCISKERLKELRSNQWSPYVFFHNGTKHSGKVKYLPSGRVHAVSRGVTYDRGTWKIKKGFVVRYAPDRPGKKRYKLRIEVGCR